MNGRRAELALAVVWAMDHDTASDLLHVLGILEDFLRQAGPEVLEELARFPLVRPREASAWAHWLAGYLGDHALALRAATTTTTTTGTEPTPSGPLP